MGGGGSGSIMMARGRWRVGEYYDGAWEVEGQGVSWVLSHKQRTWVEGGCLKWKYRGSNRFIGGVFAVTFISKVRY